MLYDRIKYNIQSYAAILTLLSLMYKIFKFENFLFSTLSLSMLCSLLPSKFKASKFGICSLTISNTVINIAGRNNAQK